MAKFDTKTIPHGTDEEVKTSAEAMNKAVETAKQATMQTPVEHVMTTQSRRMEQLPLAKVPIDIKAFGHDFFLLEVDQRNDKTDYLIACMARKLDKIRVTIDGSPMISPREVENNMVKVDLENLRGRFWQNDHGAGVIFQADAIKKTNS